MSVLNGSLYSQPTTPRSVTRMRLKNQDALEERLIHQPPVSLSRCQVGLVTLLGSPYGFQDS